MEVPVMVRVLGVIPTFHALQPAKQRLVEQVVVLHHAALLEEMHGQQGQGHAGGGLRKAENVKLPIAAGILHYQKLMTQVVAVLSLMFTTVQT